MDGVAGFEPAHDRIKVCWLTTCRHPNSIKNILDFIQKIKINFKNLKNKANKQLYIGIFTLKLAWI